MWTEPRNYYNLSQLLCAIAYCEIKFYLSMIEVRNIYLFLTYLCNFISYCPGHVGVSYSGPGGLGRIGFLLICWCYIRV